MKKSLKIVSKILILAVFVWVGAGALQANSQGTFNEETRENLRNQLNQTRETKKKRGQKRLGRSKGKARGVEEKP